MDNKHKAAAELEATREAALQKLTTESVCEVYRAGETQPALVDRDKRIVELSFSSEFPYARDYGYEVLDHSPGAFDLTFLNSGQAPFMVAPKSGGMHEGAIQIGSIIKNSARVDSDRKGRARVRISRSPMGDSFLNDLEDDVAVNISFGYRAAQPQVVKDKAGVATVRWMKTNPREITRVPLAADPTVGVGRAAEEVETGKTNSEVKEENMTIEEGRAAETARLDYIEALGKRFKQEVVATRCALEGKSEDEARSAILEAFNTSQGKEVETPGQTRDGDDAGKKPDLVIYSGVKSFAGTRQEAGEKAYRFAKWFLAGPLGHIEGSRAINAAKDFCRDNGIKVVRGQTEGDDTAGGVLVPHEFTNDMIDLREKYGVFRPNVRVVPMASDSKSMPRRKSGLTAYVIGEGTGATESQKGWDRVGLSAKKIGCLARYSSEIAEDSLVSIGDDLAREIAYAFVQFEDTVGFTGNGSKAHMGCFGVLPRLQALADATDTTSIVTASGNAWSEWTITEFLDAIGKLPEYAEVGSVKWFCSKVFWATVMQRIKYGLGGTDLAAAENGQNRTFLGYPVEVSQVFPRLAVNGKVPVFIGNLPLAAMLGDRRQTTIATSEHVHFEDEEFLIRGTERFDINVHNVQGTAAEIAAGIAGPLVGIVNASS